MSKNSSLRANGATKKTMVSRQLSGSLDESIGFLICDTARFVKRALYTKISHYGVRGGSWFFLRVLWLEDGITQRELSRRLGIMQPSALEMLRCMEEDGMIYRVRDTKDRRRILVHLTDDAKRLHGELMPIASEINELMLHQMALTSETSLKKTLKRIRQVLSNEIAGQALQAKDLADVSEFQPRGRKTKSTAAGTPSLQRKRRKGMVASTR